MTMIFGDCGTSEDNQASRFYIHCKTITMMHLAMNRGNLLLIFYCIYDSKEQIIKGQVNKSTSSPELLTEFHL